MKLFFETVAIAILASFATVTAQDLDIVGVAASNKTFKTLVAAVTAADLVETLQGEGPFTVFAPTNAAFKKLPEGNLESLLEPANKETLTAILLYHVVAGKVLSTDLSDGAVATVGGEEIDIDVTSKTVKINTSTKVKTADVEATNGVIHVINRVLIPPSLRMPMDIVGLALDSPFLKTLVAAVTAADLVETLQGEGPFTVFAPTNIAFKKLGSTLDDLLLPETKETLTSILLYHVVPAKALSSDLVDDSSVTTVQGEDIGVDLRKHADGVQVKLNGSSKVKIADLEATNGVVHVINRVLIPPSLA